MLTRAAIKRLQFVYTLATFFCIVPLDWDPKTKTLTATKYKLKVFFNKLISYGILVIMTFLGLSMALDLANNYEEIPGHSLIINTFLLVCGFAVGIIALACNTYPFSVSYGINNVFRKDQRFQETLLTRKEVEDLQRRPSLVKIFSTVLEPISIIHSFAVSMLFFQEYDLFRRYVYYYFEKYLLPLILNYVAISPIWFQLIFALAYFGFVRLIYGFFLVFAISIVTYYESTSFWLNYITTSPRILDGPFEEALHMFRMEQILFIQLMHAEFFQIIAPVGVVSIFTVLVICNYCTVTMYDTLNLSTYLAMPTLSILLTSFLEILFVKAGVMYKLTADFGNVWAQRRKTSIVIQKTLVTCRPFLYRVSHVINVEPSTFLDYMSHVIDRTVDFLLMG